MNLFSFFHIIQLLKVNPSLDPDPAVVQVYRGGGGGRELHHHRLHPRDRGLWAQLQPRQ